MASEVTIELRQTLNGFFSRFGAYMVRRAANKTIDEALDGLERIGGSCARIGARDRRPQSLAYVVRHAPCVLAQLALRAHDR